MYRRLEIASARLEERGPATRADYEPMLRRLAGEGQTIEPLRTLAEVVEPVKLYRRGQSRDYTQQTPLDRLVDAARPESEASRRLHVEVERWLDTAPAFAPSPALREPLARWVGNQAPLDALLARKPEKWELAELRPLSRNLSRLAKLGVDALEHLEKRRVPTAAWRTQAEKTLADASVAHAEVELALRRPVRELVVAAQKLDRLETLGPRGLARRSSSRDRDRDAPLAPPKGRELDPALTRPRTLAASLVVPGSAVPSSIAPPDAHRPISRLRHPALRCPISNCAPPASCWPVPCSIPSAPSRSRSR